jgi:hypothetical protein
MGDTQMLRPPDYTAIKDAVPGTVMSFIGILTDIIGPSRVSTGWELGFTIYDGFTAPSFQQSSSIRCRIARPEKARLPVGSINDPVLVRNINVTKSNGFLEGNGSKAAFTEVLIFPANKIPIPQYSAPYGQGGGSTLPFSGWARPTTPSEQLAIINFKALAVSSSAMQPSAMEPSAMQPPATSRPSANAPKAFPRSKKDALIKDVQVSRFCNLAVEVVKIFDRGYGHDTLDLYVTDYTTNKDLYLYEDPKHADAYSYAGSSDWKGPFGQVTMAIHLWEPHTSYTREEIEVGDLVFISNVHIKWSAANKIEGALHQDPKFPAKVQIHKIVNRDQIAAHAERKEAYEGAQTREPAHQPHQPKKPSAKKSAKKKEEKKARGRQEKEAEQRHLEKKLEEEAAARANLNQHGG